VQKSATLPKKKVWNSADFPHFVGPSPPGIART
jgi:hypothetical protein